MFARLQTLWDEMIRLAECDREKDKNIIINTGKKLVFQEIFEESYNNIKDRYMTNEVVFLDRHKVASIIIYTIIKTKILEYQIIDENKVFLGNYYLALSAGLSYLQYELNQILQGKGELPIDKFIFPSVMYGKKSYIDNLISMLCFSDEENGLDILALSNIMFLLEYFNLLHKGISLT